MSESATTNENGLGLTLPDEATDQRERWLWAAVLALVALVAFAPSMQGDFIWDDDRHPQNRVLQRGVEGLADVWFAPSQAPVDGQPRRYTTPQYYPMTFTSYWIEQQLWGDNPMGYHAVNMLLHAGSALLLWEILRRLGVPGAWMGAALFAVHPIQAESVAWITERKNVLAGAFFFGSILAYLKFLGMGEGSVPGSTAVTAGGAQGPAIEERKPDWQWYGAALGLFVCALLSKTIACSLPVVVGILIWWKRGRVTARDVGLLAPFLVLGLIMASVTAWMEVNVVRAVGPDWDLNFVQRLLIAGRAIWFYVYKLFVPVNFNFTYERWEITGADALGWLGVAATIGVVALLAALRGKMGRGVLAAVLIYLVTLVPAMGFFNVYPMRYSFVADHFQYLSGVALLALAAAGGAAGLRRVLADNSQALRMVGLVLSCVALLALGAVSFAQSRIYRNNETLWRATIAGNPGAWMAHYNLGVELLKQADQDMRDLIPDDAERKAKEAIERFRVALEQRKDHADALNNWGAALLILGEPEAALEKFEQAVRMNPSSSRFHTSQGMALARLGRLEEAVGRYQKAIELNPRSTSARYNLASVWMLQAQLAERQAAGGTTEEEKELLAGARALNVRAQEELKRVLEIRQDHAEAWHKLGVSLLREGRNKEAFDAIHEAVTLRPDLAEAHVDLGALYAKAGRLPEAGQEYTKAAQLMPENADLRVRMGFLAGMLGNTKASREFFEMALTLDPENVMAKQGLEALARAATQPATTRAATMPSEAAGGGSPGATTTAPQQ